MSVSARAARQSMSTQPIRTVGPSRLKVSDRAYQLGRWLPDLASVVANSAGMLVPLAGTSVESAGSRLTLQVYPSARQVVAV